MSCDVLDRLSHDGLSELDAMMRMIQRAQAFVLAFVVINHSSLRDALIEECKRRVPDDTILVIRLDSTESIVSQIKREVDAAASDQPKAIFLTGLESMLEIAGTPLSHLETLNLNRSYCGHNFPFPIVFWTPEYAIREFSRQASDFWSCRSGVYRISATMPWAQETISEIKRSVTKSLNSPGHDWERRRLHELLQDVDRELHSEYGEGAENNAAFAASRVEVEGLLAELAGYARDRGLQEQHLRRKLDIAQMIGDRNETASSSEQLGDLTSRIGRYDDARTYYEEALELYRQAKNLNGEVDCVRGLGWIALMRADYPEAGMLFERALHMAIAASYSLGEGHARRCLGHIRRVLGYHEEAKGFYHQALTAYRKLNNRQAQINCIEGLGDVAWMQSKYAKAGRLYQKALAISKEVFDLRGEAGCLEGLGHVEFMFAQYDAATNRYLQALSLYRLLSHRRGEANSIRALGEVDRIRNRNDEAERRFKEALGIYQEIGHRRGEADAIRALGHLARVLDNPELATENYEKALQIYQDIGYRWGQAGCLEGLGDLDRAEKRFKEAWACYGVARELSRDVGDRKGEAGATRDIGDAAWMMKRYKHASKCYAKARQIAHEIKDKWGEAAFIRDQGDAAWMIGKYGRARAYYEEALRLSQDIGDRWGEADTICKLGNVAWKLGEVGDVARLYRKALFKYRETPNAI